MTASNSIKARLDEAKWVMQRQMARIAELEAEVERLRSAANAHDVLRAIYSDSNQPTGHRLKAAGLALGVESPPLKSVEPPLDLVAEPPISLLELAERRMKKQLALEGQEIRVLDDGTVLQLKPGNGSGSDEH
jgi:hypothetical protein